MSALVPEIFLHLIHSLSISVYYALIIIVVLSYHQWRRPTLTVRPTNCIRRLKPNFFYFCPRFTAYWLSWKGLEDIINTWFTKNEIQETTESSWLASLAVASSMSVKGIHRDLRPYVTISSVTSSLHTLDDVRHTQTRSDFFSLSLSALEVSPFTQCMELSAIVGSDWSTYVSFRNALYMRNYELDLPRMNFSSQESILHFHSAWVWFNLDIDLVLSGKPYILHD